MSDISVTCSSSNGLSKETINGCNRELYDGHNLLDFGPPTELRIPVPYGHIAAKVWGPSDGEPVLGIHGWQDNAGTFDKIIGYLPDNLHFVVIDLSGHGLSSHLPAGSIYGANQYLLDVRRVISFLGWNKFSFLAHSLGAYIASYYCAIYPDKIIKFASLDILYPGSKAADPNSTRKFLENYIKEEALEFDAHQFAVSPDYALDLMWQRREGLTKEGAKPLMIRGCKTTDKGIIFTRDHRLKSFVYQPWEFGNETTTFRFLENIRCNMFVIAVKDSQVFTRHGELQIETQKILEKGCTRFKIVHVEGGHFVHLVKPGLIGPLLREFFLEDFDFQAVL